MAICIQSNQEYRHSKLFSIWRGIRRNTLTVIGFFIVTLFLLMAIFGTLFVPYEYAEQNIEK